MKKFLFWAMYIGMAGYLLAISTGISTFDGPTGMTGPSTNTTTFTAITLSETSMPGNNPLVSLGVSFSNVSTNSSGAVTVYFAVSRDGTVFETPIQSNFKVVVNQDGTAVQTHGDWFNLSGVQKIKVGRIENTGTAVTNFSITLTHSVDP